MATGQQIASLATAQLVYSVAFSPDGKTLATGDDDGTARLWDVATGQQIRSLLPAPAQSARWRSARTARPWPPAATTARPGCGTWPPGGRSAASLRAPAPVSSVAFSPDGKTLATGGADGTARLWNLATGQQIRACLPAPARSTRWRSARTARPWPPATPTARHCGTRLPASRSAASTGPGAVHSVAFSPDGKTLATGDQTARRGCGTWPPASQIRSLLPATSTVLSVAFSPDGKTLATGDDDGTAGCGTWPPGSRSAA